MKLPVFLLPRYLCLFLIVCIPWLFYILLLQIYLMWIMLKVLYLALFTAYPGLANSFELFRYFWLSFRFQFALQNFIFIFCCFYIFFSTRWLLSCFCLNTIHSLCYGTIPWSLADTAVFFSSACLSFFFTFFLTWWSYHIEKYKWGDIMAKVKVTVLVGRSIYDPSKQCILGLLFNCI